MSTVQSRPMRRSDAVRNRERILEAARGCFQEQGADVPLEEIAAAAGITRMSLSRHFPSRVAIAIAIYEENVDLIEHRSEVLVGQLDAIVQFADYVWTMSADNRNLLEFFARVGEADWLAGLAERTQAVFESHLAVGRASGVLRADVSSDDLMVTISMVRGIDPLRPAALDRVKEFLRRAVFTDAGRDPASL